VPFIESSSILTTNKTNICCYDEQRLFILESICDRWSLRCYLISDVLSLRMFYHVIITNKPMLSSFDKCHLPSHNNCSTLVCLHCWLATEMFLFCGWLFNGWAIFVSLLSYPELTSILHMGLFRGLAVACWTTDHYHPCSNLGLGISEGCFIFDFDSLPLEVARPI